MDRIYSNTLIENANQILDIDKKLLDIGWDDNKKSLRDSLRLVKNKHYKVIRELYEEYKILIPYFYFNQGILTSTGSYAGEFQIDKNYNK